LLADAIRFCSEKCERGMGEAKRFYKRGSQMPRARENKFIWRRLKGNGVYL
jgi:hypothetical protein